MAIYGQPNSWTCGPFALKHALLAHGVFAGEGELGRLAGSTEDRGTDETGLRRAARAHGADLLIVRSTDAGRARRELSRLLDHGDPVLLCLDQWEHWVTAVAADREHVVIFDSKYDAPLRAEPWDALLPRVEFRRDGFGGLWTRTLYDLHPLVRRRAPAFRLALTPARWQYLLREDGALARRWDDYARVILPLAVASNGVQLTLGHELERYIEARRDAILDLAAGGAAPTDRAAQVVQGLAFVAGMYRATLLPEAEAGAVAQLAGALAALLALEAATPPAPAVPAASGAASAAA